MNAVHESSATVQLAIMSETGETELDHTHFSILAVAHKRHHKLGASWAQRNFLALKDAPLGSGINFSGAVITSIRPGKVDSLFLISSRLW